MALPHLALFAALSLLPLASALAIDTAETAAQQRRKFTYATGRESYAARCAMCHGPSGEGKWSPEGGFPPLKGYDIDRWFVLPEGRQYVARVIIFGPYGEVFVGDKLYIGMMPRFRPRIDDKEMVLLVRYLAEEMNTPLPGYVPITEAEINQARLAPDNMESVTGARHELPPR